MNTRYGKPIALGITIVLLITAAYLATLAYGAFDRVGYVGVDIIHYLDGTRRWLATGSPYVPSEVAGPFVYAPETFLHPPIALPLLLPFTVLPLPLWWIIPVGIVAWFVWACRPAPWTWPVMALMLCSPRFHGAFIVGNSDLWIWAGVAAGLRFGWPALVVVVKPSMFPLVLAGIRHRSWWAGALGLGVISLAFGSLWLEWIAVVRNSPGDWTYSLRNLTWLLLPLVAWIGRRSARVAEHPNARGTGGRWRRRGERRIAV